MIKMMKYGEVPSSEIFARGTAETDVSDIVADILAEVRQKGDAALLAYAKQFDKADLQALEVSEAEIDAAFQKVEPAFIAVLQQAAENIRAFHRRQVRNSFVITGDGIVTGQKITPIAKVGLYVPGGTAAYPSTVLMDAIPAKIAGCKEICITTPALPDGSINPVILAAQRSQASIRIFKTAAHRQSQRWPTVRRAFRRSTRSSARAMHLWQRPSGRYSDWSPSI